MAEYGNLSAKRLSGCDPRLQILFNFVVRYYDNSILCGHRNEVDQSRAYQRKRSKVQWPNSNHNAIPSKAVDAAPWPIDWDDRERFVHFAGAVKLAAEFLGIAIRWGGDWDDDGTGVDNNFDDLVHFEIID